MARKKNEKAAINIQFACDRALDLERRKALIEEEQKQLEKDIKAYAKANPAGRVTTDGGGWSVQYPCTDGSFIRVTKAGDTLVGSIAADDEDLPKVRELAGGAFADLFVTQVSYGLADKFRDEATRLLPQTADRLIDLVSKVGKTDLGYQVAKKPVV